MKKKQSLYTAFVIAFKGIGFAFKERNFLIDTFCAIIAIIIGFILKISSLEWIAILFCIALVLCLEMLNTVIEKTIDLLHPQQHSKAGEIKDIAAGSVLVAVIFSGIIGGIIFLPKILLKCSGV
ncbi:MAG: diacylglycerol kinase family protein [Bacteroidia bacterium]|nr:diacylglycerol kinase family protein [Bacteroidia bacterium]